MAFIVLRQIVNLRMAVMAPGNAVIRPGFLYLPVFEPSIMPPGLIIARLKESSPSATAVIVGPVGGHIHEVFFSYNRLYNKTQIFSNRITVTFSNDLARVLDGKFDVAVFIPIAVGFQFAFPDPFGVVFIDILNVELMINVEFFQSGPDCKGNMPSFRV